jgi:hypothetical protein
MKVRGCWGREEEEEKIRFYNYVFTELTYCTCRVGGIRRGPAGGREKERES